MSKFNLSIGVLFLICAVSCSVEEKGDNCADISNSYAAELTVKLKKQTESLHRDMVYVYSRLDIVHIQIIAGTRQLGDSIYVNRMFLLKDESLLVQEKVTKIITDENYDRE